MKQQFVSRDSSQTINIGRAIGQNLNGGEVIELQSDIGGGKTTLVRGLVQGFGSDDPVASPSFTINLSYTRPDKKVFHHFDFYRLNDAGIMINELAELLGDKEVVTAIEWSDVVQDVLPAERIIIKIQTLDDTSRRISIEYPTSSSYIVKDIDE